ncbi:hypothetical protein UT300019_29630 [Clostridium sp. CTA-19]
MELLGTGFDLLVEKYKTRRVSDVSEENKLTVPVPFVMEVELGIIAYLVEVVLWKLTMNKGQLTIMEETGLPVSFELEGVNSRFERLN